MRQWPLKTLVLDTFNMSLPRDRSNPIRVTIDGIVAADGFPIRTTALELFTSRVSLEL